MALYTSAQASSTHGKRPSMSMYGGANASLLIEKTKSDIRHSTPDSEALASSDDEQDQHHQLPFVNNPHNLRSIRRSSWLNDSQQVLQRGASLSGGGTFSSGIPYSTTPAAESWTSTAGSSNNVAVGRSHANSASFPWGNALWNVDSPKGPPSRLTEVLPSPTTTNPSDARLPSDDTPISSSIRRESVAESAIPFAIPLHPTPKTYRSQSYSVGQLDPELVHGLPGQMQHFYPGRTRAGSSYTGLQHRPSRPSMLSDVTYDTSVLSQLREVEDDEESTSDRSEVEMPLTDTQARTIKRLAMENALLRQAAATNYLREPHMSRTPHMTDTDSSNMKEGFEKQRETNEVTFEDADCPRTGIHQTNHSRVLNQYSNVGQSFGEYNTDERGKFSSSLILDNRKTESVKKGVWQSSLGFGGYASVPQSRRHSFAAVPTHHNSISSVDHTKNNHAGMQEENILHHDMRLASGFEDKSVNELHGGNSEYINSRLQFALQEQHLEEENLHSQIYAASYFSKVSPASRNTDIRPQINPSSFVPQDLARGTAHHRHQHLIPPQAYHGQSLYVVTFKACRADFYYVQEGTGLHVKNGDLVIVEADRGADLGTVAHENIDWAAARSLKEHYAREHYRWLMMFSRHEQRGFSASFHSNPLALPHGVNAGATTGMGSARQSTTSEPFDLDTKPKMIKRLAQAHEIQTLRDKEANEAKAKRTCQQKVAEHHLQMEILDAEFQMDWKKLTFFYFADSYINFNALVTDLFKIYKTRIWMSAINPASFVTSIVSSQIGSSLVVDPQAIDRDTLAESRSKLTGIKHKATTPTLPSQGTFDRSWYSSQGVAVPAVYAPLYPAHTFQEMTPPLHDIRPGACQTQRSQSPFTLQYYDAINHVVQRPYGEPKVTNEASDGPSAAKSVNSWSTSFQRLSLGS